MYSSEVSQNLKVHSIFKIETKELPDRGYHHKLYLELRAYESHLKHRTLIA